jgi:hypothetical protein
MVVTESTRGIDGSRARPLRDPGEVRRILDDRAHFIPSFADIFTAEDDVTRARQLDWQDRADPTRSGEHTQEWRALRRATSERLARSTDALATAIARGVLLRVRAEPRPIERDIVAPAIVDALRAEFAPHAELHDPTFVLGLTPAATDDEERRGSQAAGELAHAAGDSNDSIGLALEATADTVALLGNAIPDLGRTRLAMLDDSERDRLADTLARKHRPRVGSLRIVRAATSVSERRREEGDEIWLDLRAANEEFAAGSQLEDRWDPLIAASIELSERCLARLVDLILEHRLRLVSPEVGEERGTFFWHELRGGTVARQ